MSEKDTIEKLLEGHSAYDEEAMKELNRNVQKKMRKYVYGRILLVLIIVALLVTGFFKGRDIYLEKNSWHINELEWISQEEPYDGRTNAEQEASNAMYYIQAYYSIFAPGYIAWFNQWPMTYERLDYGKYQLDFKLLDSFRTSFETLSFVHEPLQSIQFIDGIITEPSETYDLYSYDTLPVWWNLPNSYSVYEWTIDRSQQKEVLDQLPDSAYVNMDMQFENPCSFEELLLLQSEYPDSRIAYVITHEIELNDGYKKLMGFNVSGQGQFMFPSKEALDKYPGLFTLNTKQLADQYRNDSGYIRTLQQEGLRKKTAESYRNYYQSAIELLLNNHVLDEHHENVCEKVLEDMKENEIKVLGIRFYLSRKDALRILEEDNILSTHMQDIKMNRLDN